MEVLRDVAAAMQRGPFAALYPSAKRLALATIRFGDTAAFIVARALVVPLRLLPKTVQAHVNSAFAPVARLDYTKHRILLHVESPGALYRTHACRKEPETVRWIEEYVQPGDVLYDVGANVGAYSLIAARHGQGRVRVLAFEPSFSTYALLCRNVVLNGCDATVSPHLICLTETPGLVTFVYSSLEPGSALHQTGRQDDTPAATTAYRQATLGFSIDVLVAQFGFAAPNHIKIDVDGAELLVLRGASETLGSGQVRTLHVEVSPEEPSAAEITALLERKGFELVSDTARGGGTRWSNRLYVVRQARTASGGK
jgi:FkbM family methyltransferase